MSLSKKNLDKLNSFIKNSNIEKENFSNNNFKENPNKLIKAKKVNDPQDLFYSIIDNENDLNEVSDSINLLKNSEEEHHKFNPRKSSLSNEDKLYDEFNYLLEE